MPLPVASVEYAPIIDEKEQKRLKKRAQNRLSQRCIREKQLVKIQQLERRLSLLQAQTHSPPNVDATALNVQLLKENEDLRDTLQAMRKQLLSIGTMATSAAGSIVCKTVPTQLGTPSDSSEVGLSQFELEPDFPGSESCQRDSRNSCGQILHSSMKSSAANSWKEFDNAMFRDQAFNEIQWEHWLMGNINPSSSLMVELENLVKDISSKVKLSNLHLLLLARTLNLVKAGLNEGSAECIDNGTVNDLVRLAVRMIVSLSPRAGYIQISDSIKVVEDVIRWRINPTPLNMALLPSHLQPTELQKQSPDRHPYIDFVPWPELRDQLIICPEVYDMAMLMVDIVRETVREVQECCVAFPVLDFQARLKHPTAPRNAPLTELLELSVKEGATQSPKQRMLFAREVQRYGLDRVKDWRLSPDFFRKYPGLNVPLLILELPIVDFNTAQLYFGHASMQQATANSLHIAGGHFTTSV